MNKFNDIFKKIIESIEEVETLLSIKEVKKLIPDFVKAAQLEYDNWDETDDDTYAGGGICHLIADSIANILSSNGFDAAVVSSPHEQHAVVFCKVIEGVYQIDVPWRTYERGGGYSWKKIPDVVFNSNDIDFYQIDNDPANFDELTEEY
jgi:hypothetical protein